VGGPATFLSMFHLSGLYPRHQSLIVSLINGAFDSSTVVFLLFAVLHSAFDLSHHILFLVYSLLPALMVCVVWIWPRYSVGTAKALTHADAAGRGDSAYSALDLEEDALAVELHTTSVAQSSSGGGPIRPESTLLRGGSERSTDGLLSPEATLLRGVSEEDSVDLLVDPGRDPERERECDPERERECDPQSVDAAVVCVVPATQADGATMDRVHSLCESEERTNLNTWCDVQEEHPAIGIDVEVGMNEVSSVGGGEGALIANPFPGLLTLSLKEQMRRVEYWTVVLFTVLHMLRLNLYLGTANDQLIAMGFTDPQCM
jgi:hypothetical protein